MSATTTTPQQQPTKAPRRQGKKQRPTDGSLSDVGVPTEYQRHTSPSTAPMAKNSNKGQPARKTSKANKNPQSESATSAAGKQNNSRSSQDKTRATPVKPAAYAGATFQQSPAASDLPLPSFYSKSLPATSRLSSEIINSGPVDAQASSVATTDQSPSKGESTPCDFLFQAARQARATPRQASPVVRSGNLSVPNGSPASRSPAPRDGDAMFPFELEGGATPGEDGSPFATPYKDRMEALRTTKSTASGSKSMDENERRAKSDALKQLLMQSSGQGRPTGPDPGFDLNNPFNARAPYQQPTSYPQGPTLAHRMSAPAPSPYMQQRSVYTSQTQPQQGFQYAPVHPQTQKRPTSSRLRNVYGAQNELEYAELSSDSAVTPPIASAGGHPQLPKSQYTSDTLEQPYPNQPQIPGHRTKPSAQQLEDDLRRVLKLDLTSRG
ncbi:hypothetical protein ABEF95_005076 [Exophiala dermatitidis]|uniref:Proteophosphoglycan 5 n=1 Tax=Exophiala dermatitidis (strain ATCC 34100 / CBS 525.76 / NIH/UT8656) TaxID=858893 RepID=H6BYX2_EXODN|nr:uncharacterized protein HMPREF1120_04899 [Exophiala dermatitidis NIH/UT8656]EHY56835.1 hypothetical protein HMPREF1120_04899 [Exophiala dermatitidis NIH/UT8656]